LSNDSKETNSLFQMMSHLLNNNSNNNENKSLNDKNLKALKSSNSTDIEANKAINLTITSYILNQILTAEAKQQKLNTSLTSDSIPKDFPFKLNTKYFEDIFPDMAAKYPDTELMMNLSISGTPNLTFVDQDQIVSLIFDLSIGFAVRAQPADTIFAFKTNSTFELQFIPSTDITKLFVNIHKLEFNNSTITFECGAMTPEQIETTLNPFFDGIKDFINSNMLNNGVSIPKIKGITLNKLLLSIFGGKLNILTEPSF